GVSPPSVICHFRPRGPCWLRFPTGCCPSAGLFVRTLADQEQIDAFRVPIVVERHTKVGVLLYQVIHVLLIGRPTAGDEVEALFRWFRRYCDRAVPVDLEIRNR